MLDRLNSPQVWQDFLEYRRSGGHMSAAQERALAAFIEAEAYRPVVERIRRGETFAPPKKSAISKKHSAKKRIVYTYAEDENWVLKLLTHLLQGQYDHLFADNLYSFRQGTGVRDAIRRLTGTPDIRRMWSYKVDISNYFNSVPVDRVRTLLGNTLADEPETVWFLESLLMNPLVEDNGAWVPEEKGIMAGTPISTFLANLYLASNH